MPSPFQSTKRVQELLCETGGSSAKASTACLVTGLLNHGGVRLALMRKLPWSSMIQLLWYSADSTRLPSYVKAPTSSGRLCKASKQIAHLAHLHAGSRALS